jgi:hypothetical protein
MKAQSKTLRRLIFLLLLGVLVVPHIQNKFKLFTIKPLQGAITNAPDSFFSVHEWFSGNYQEQKTKYINESFGFRNLFVRMNNQLEFTLFNYARANEVIIGKENYLYEKNYVKAYYGLDFVGKDSIDRTMQRVKFLQDTLAKLNKTLILVFASSKGTFYPEYFPDSYKQTRGTTNYEVYLKEAQKLNLNYIDFNKYFVDNKHTSKYPLCSRYGIHWSSYGERLAADSIIRYIEKARGIKMVHPFWDKIDLDNLPRNRDADIEDGMNLLFNLKCDSLAYPEIQFQSDSGKTKPSSIVIADSYYWGMYGFDISRIYSDSHFWFYNHNIYPEFRTNGLTTVQIDLKDQIAKKDIIIIMATDASLTNFGWGFVENAYDIFKGRTKKSATDHENEINIKSIINNIKSTPDWLTKVEADAKRGGITVDSALLINAKWMLEHK